MTFDRKQKEKIGEVCILFGELLNIKFHPMFLGREFCIFLKKIFNNAEFIRLK